MNELSQAPAGMPAPKKPEVTTPAPENAPVQPNMPAPPPPPVQATPPAPPAPPPAPTPQVQQPAPAQAAPAQTSQPAQQVPQSPPPPAQQVYHQPNTQQYPANNNAYPPQGYAPAGHNPGYSPQGSPAFPPRQDGYPQVAQPPRPNLPSAYGPAVPMARQPQGMFPAQPAELDTIIIPEAVIRYPALNMDHSLVLSQGINPQNVRLDLFPENMRELVQRNIAQLLPGEEDDEESGLETLERKRLNYLKCVKADAQGTKGDFKIVNIETGDLMSLRSRNETDIFVVAVQKYRQYRTDKEDPNSTVCSSFHTGAKERQIPTIFYDPQLSKGRVQSCSWCPLAPNNPTHPRNRRCQTQFIFYVVCRDDMTQVLRLFEPMKNYDGKQQKNLDKLYAQCNNGMAIAGQTNWIHIRGQEMQIPKSDNSTAIIIPNKGEVVNEAEAAIINMWRDAVAIPFSEGEKSLQFLKVKSFLQNPENYDNSQHAGSEFGAGVQF